MDRLTAVCCVGDAVLSVTWNDGAIARLDLSEIIHARANLAPLRDPAAFAGARLSDDGWSIEWPCGIDFGAPQLKAWADEQAKADAVG